MTTERFPGEQRVEVLIDLIRKSAIHPVDFFRLAQIIVASGERAFHLADLSQARTAALVRNKATHADWNAFDIDGVDHTIKFTKALLKDHLM